MIYLALNKDPLANAHAKGPSGKVGFPAYMESLHSAFLGVGYAGLNVGTILNTMTSASTPYNGTTAFNPDTDLDTSQTRYSAYNTLVTALNHQTDWDSVVAAALSRIDDGSTYPKVNIVANDIDINAISDALSVLTQALANANITAMSDSFEARATPRFLRSVSRFTGGMMDIGAVNSSAFVVGLALLEDSFLQETNKFDQELTFKVYDSVAVPLIAANIQAAATQRQQRNVMLSQATDLMIGSLFNKINANQQATHLQGELGRVKIVAKQDEAAKNLEIDVKDALWDIEAHQLAVNVLAGINGAPLVPKPLSALQSTLGGALSGASVGGQVGGAAGAGIGAVLGGALGYFA